MLGHPRRWLCVSCKSFCSLRYLLSASRLGFLFRFCSSASASSVCLCLLLISFGFILVVNGCFSIFCSSLSDSTFYRKHPLWCPFCSLRILLVLSVFNSPLQLCVIPLQAFPRRLGITLLGFVASLASSTNSRLCPLGGWLAWCRLANFSWIFLSLLYCPSSTVFIFSRYFID